MAKKSPAPTGPPEEWLIGADAKIGLGRVIRWNKGTDNITVELIDENGYHCVATYELAGWVSLPSNIQYGPEAYRIANSPLIATYRTGQAGPGRSRRRKGSSHG